MSTMCCLSQRVCIRSSSSAATLMWAWSPAVARRRSILRAAHAVPPPPPGKGGLDAFIRPAWMPSSPLRALTARLPNAKVSYLSGEDQSAAAAAAKSADVAIVFAYQWESEGMDLKSLDLCSRPEQLIEAVAAANPKTIVVLETGSPATMPWIDKVAGVVEAWYPGIRGAEALANILTGEVNPTGKLAITFPKSDADLPHPTLVKPPPSSEPNFAAMGGDISNFMAIMAKGLPPFQTYYDEKLKGRLQVVRRGEETRPVPVRLRPLLHHLRLLRADREER